MDELELKRKRLRYLELKAKAAQAAQVKPVAEQSKSNFMQPRKEFAFKNISDPVMNALKETGPEMAGTAMGAIAATGAGAVPSMVASGAGAMGGEIVNQFRQVVSGENPPKTPIESLKRQGGAFARGAISGISPEAVKQLAKPVKALGKWAGRGLEEMSGLTYKTPGVLAETVKDPSLFFADGLDTAREMYRKAKGISPQFRDEFKRILDNKKLVERSLEEVGKGTLSADEALAARKALRKVKKDIPDESFSSSMDDLQNLVKEKFGASDLAYSRGVKAENMRRLLPINKGGTPSLAKGLAMTFMPKLGYIAPPAVQGLGAAALGTALKPLSALLATPGAVPALTDFALSRLLKKK